jgi:hypothetical protein
VTLDDIRELVAGWLRRDERAVVTVVPREAAPPAVAAGGDAGDGAEPPGPMAGEDD